jgi:hypothetical protein
MSRLCRPEGVDAFFWACHCAQEFSHLVKAPVCVRFPLPFCSTLLAAFFFSNAIISPASPSPGKSASLVGTKRAMKRSSNASQERFRGSRHQLPLERFQLLTVYEGIDVEIGGPIRAEFFVVRNISLTQIRVTEGCLVVANAEKVPRLGRRLTAYARLALRAFGIDT